jgi:hypothetical protein
MEPCREGNTRIESFKAVEPGIQGQLRKIKHFFSHKVLLMGYGK